MGYVGYKEKGGRKYGETTEDKAGRGPGCLGYDEAGRKGGRERPNFPHLSQEALEV